MVWRTCPICKQFKELTEHHNPSKNTMPEQIREQAIEFICKECHDQKGINAIERRAVRIVKNKGSIVTSTNDLNSLKDKLSQRQVPQFNNGDRFIISAGTITAGSIFPISGTDIHLISRNFYQKDNWDKSEYGWGISGLNSLEEINNLRKGSDYVVTGSPSGYYYNVDIFERKNQNESLKSTL